MELKHPEPFVLEFGKIAESDFVYTLAFTNIDQSAPNLVKMYVVIKSQMSLIMDLIGPKLSELFALELENLPYLYPRKRGLGGILESACPLVGGRSVGRSGSRSVRFSVQFA